MQTVRPQLHIEPTTNNQHLPCYVGSLRTGEEGDDRCDFIGLPEAAKRNSFRGLLPVCVRHIGGHGGINESGRYDIAADIFAGIFFSHRLGKAD